MNKYPELRGRGNLTESWHLLNVWAYYEVPIGAPPLPAVAALAIVHWFAEQGYYGAAFLIAAGLDGFLRTREMLGLTWADIMIFPGKGGVVSLTHTKSGQRTAAFEASVILDPMVEALHARAKAGRLPGTAEDGHIFPGSDQHFYKLWQQCLKALRLEELGFRPYSLRRGGATAYYRACRSMENTIERGRRANYEVARIYINDGLAKEAE